MSPERNEEAIEKIDQGLKDASEITIEDGINWAIEHGHMTPREGELCLEAYRKTFHKREEP